MPEVSVVLPTYNERDNIGPLIEAILANLDQPTQIIVGVQNTSPCREFSGLRGEETSQNSQFPIPNSQSVGG